MCEIRTVNNSTGLRMIQKGRKMYFQNFDGKRFLKNRTIIFDPIAEISVPRGFITTEENLEKIVCKLLGV